MATPDFSPDLAVGTACRVLPAALHPTQFALGMEEVRYRTAKLRAMRAGARHEYLVERQAPLVIGPGDVPYLVDHHHLARAMLRAAPSNQLHARIIARWNTLSPAVFWGRMKTRHWVWLFDANGRGPRAVSRLPATLAAMGDDPYRSLAWAIRERGVVEKVVIPFAEFRWAMWLRDRYPHLTGNFAADTAACVELAKEKGARRLPGWRESKGA
jgi:hypothetical protein